MRTKWPIWFFVIPGGLIFLIFFIAPTIYGLVLSFTNWDGLSAVFQWVGFQNYSNMFTNDAVFWDAVTNTMNFVVVTVILQSFFSLVFALILIKNTKTNILFRALFFFPTILATISVAFIWMFMYDPNIGIINTLLGAIGLSSWQQDWLGNKLLAIYCLSIVQVWAHIGQLMIVYLAGLQQIPQEYYEAATMEGATRWQIFRSITWPLLIPATTMVVAYTTIQSFQAFVLVYSLTNGGPGNATQILGTYIYNQAFMNNHFGYAAAISVVFMAIIILLTLAQFGMLRFEGSSSRKELNAV